MPSSISRSRRQNAFNEGRRAAKETLARNPYQNPKLQALWEQGRAQEAAGQIKTPIPALDHGQTRARTPERGPQTRAPSSGRPRNRFGGDQGRRPRSR